MSPQINIFINGNKFKQREQFKYLGTLISSDGCNNTDIASRIAQAKKFSENEIDTNISIETREESWSVMLNPFWCMDAKPEQLQNKYKRN